MVVPQSLLLLLTCTTGLIEAFVAGSRPHSQEPASVKRRQNGDTPYPITGIQTGQVVPRVEIRDLQDNYPDQFNILLLGWRKLQQMNQSNFLSYFRIAGMCFQ
jgi:hypothetical protein